MKMNINVSLGKAALTVLFLSTCICHSIAQYDSVSLARIYRTWIKLNNHQGTLEGVLHEIKDSSVLISFSLSRKDYLSGNFSTREIPYNNIDMIRTRGKNSIITGTLVGFAAGMGITYQVVRSSVRSDEIPGAMLLYGSPFICIFSGIGAMFGAIRANITIGSSYSNFKSNETRLERRSLVKEYNEGLNKYEKVKDHKWYAGFIYKITFPSGDFVKAPADKPEDIVSSIGGGAGINFGMPIVNNFGITASVYNSTFLIPSSPEKMWNLGEYMAGPALSFHLNRVMILDTKCIFGIAVAEKFNGDVEEISGAGPGMNLGAAYRYNFARRWCFLADAGYMMAWQNISTVKQFNSTFNIGAGMAYRFK